MQFRIKGTFMHITARIVRGLIRPVILGWDFFSKYSAYLDPACGQFRFMNGKSAPLIANTESISGCYYRVHEDLVIPANSKMHTEVELMLDGDAAKSASQEVTTDPYPWHGGDIWACRSISRVNEGKILTELINTGTQSVKLEAGTVLGYAEFVDDEFNEAGMTVETDMFCSYKGDDSAYETGDEEDEENLEEIEMETRPSKDQCDQQKDTTHPVDDTIPKGAKRLSINYSTMAKDALPYEEELKDLLEVKHAKAFSNHDRDYGKTDLIHFQANLKDRDDTPIAVPPYRTRPEMREAIEEQAFQMIADGLVSHSTSPYSAPILLARKKLGGWRFLTDFRKINERCVKVVYPLPRIEDSIHSLENPKFFSSMDLTKGFWQIPIHPDDRKFFAFSTGTMHLEYLVAPMGAKNSPSCLSALMQLVLRGLPPQHVISYLDDILCADSTMEDHIKHLDQVLAALEKAGLKLNPAKCSFAQESVVCLGHKLSRDGISPDPNNVEKIKSWKAPENAKRLKTFLGLSGYYRSFVKDYSKIAQKLTDLTHEGTEWKWTNNHQEAFETLRDILTSDVVMCYPDFEKPLIIKSDASLSAIGYVLTQNFGKKEKVISYGSKKLTRPQQNWSTYDREFFGLLTAIRANSHYLRHAHFLAITDHRPLLAWRKVDVKKDPTGRRTRWAIELDTYDFELVHKKGKTHSDADAMSRRGDDDDDFATDDEEFAGFIEEGENKLMLYGMQEIDEYSAIKFNIRSSEKRRLLQHQDADAILREVKNFVRQCKAPPRNFPEKWFKTNFKRLVLKNNVLYRKSYSPTVHAPVLQAIIPTTLVEEVMQDMHGSTFAGHPSFRKMQQKLERHVIWPTLAKDIEQFVKTCVICDKLRQPVPGNKTPLQPIVAENIFDHVICDLLKLPLAPGGFQYVLVFKDVFSGYTSLYKLRTKVSQGVTKCLEDYVCRYGIPRRLTSDNGGEFCSEIMEAVCKVLGIKKGTSVAYRPESQGTVERQNRTLIKDLTKRLQQYGKSWVDHLAYAEWSFNTTPFSKTDMSPYFIFFGREPPVPSFSGIEEVGIRERSLRDYVQKMKERVKTIHDKARDRIAEKQAKEEEKYNRKAKHDPLEEGELVYESVPKKYRHKLQPKWSGPLKVTKRRSSPSGEPGTTYVCQRLDGTSCNRNYEQLKRVNARYEEAMAVPLTKSTDKFLIEEESLNLLMVLTAKQDLANPDMPIARRTRSQPPEQEEDPPDHEENQVSAGPSPDSEREDPLTAAPIVVQMVPSPTQEEEDRHSESLSTVQEINQIEPRLMEELQSIGEPTYASQIPTTSDQNSNSEGMTTLRVEPAARNTKNAAPENYTHPTTSTFKLGPPKKPITKKKEESIRSTHVTLRSETKRAQNMKTCFKKLASCSNPEEEEGFPPQNETAQTEQSGRDAFTADPIANKGHTPAINEGTNNQPSYKGTDDQTEILSRNPPFLMKVTAWARTIMRGRSQSS